MITIEKYKSDMVADLWQVYFTAIRMVCIKDYSEEQVKAWAPDSFDFALLQEKFDKLKPFVAKIDAKIVGYGDLQSDGLLDHFFVHGEHQSKGVARVLMNTILESGKEMPMLYSHVSMTAKPFFEANGFIVQKVQEVETRGCKMKNNIMQRKQG